MPRLSVRHMLANPYVRIALILSLAALVWRASFFIGSLIFGGAHTDYDFNRHLTHALLVFILATPIPLLLWKYLDRRPWAEMGLTKPSQAWKDFLIGMVIWLIPASLGLILCLSLGMASIELIKPIADIIAFIPLLTLLVLLYEAVPEELIFRGYIFANLSQKMKGYAVVAAQAALFTLWGIAIGAATTPDRIIFFIAAAWVIGSIRRISGSTWTTIGYHIAFQTMAQLLLNESRGFFTIDNLGTLQLIALGLIPFISAELLARIFYKTK